MSDARVYEPPVPQPSTLNPEPQVRVRSLCAKAERVLEDAEELLEAVLVHPLPSVLDTLREC